jgi:2-polyprenyl-3-methyl-5-hydroxy-6-metoxy-1,4-benzoquinol methylase
MEKNMMINGKTDQQKECYLCGGKKFKKRPGSVRDRPELEVFECASCGLVFLSSSDHIRDRFYENSGMHGEDILNIQYWIRETEWDDERRFQYLKSALQNQRLLDFGCGTGGFLLKARALAATAHGVELETRLSRHYESRGLTVFQNLSEISNDIHGEGYDIITIFHVLEHVPDPKAILSELTEMLSNGGQIIVEVPNADDALLTLYQCEPFSNFTYWSCHLFLFTAKTLKMLFSQVNLKVIISNRFKDIRWPITSTGWQMENLAAIKNGIFLIRLNYIQLMKNNLQLLANVIRSWQVFLDIENIGVKKLCSQNWAT